ncbi:MAG: 50S ribosomal protein L23 [Solirubrobacterales bacterium]
MDPRTVIIEPVVSEKSYALMGVNKYTFRVHDDAHKTQIAQAIEEIFDVKVAKVRTQSVKAKPKRRNTSVGRTRDWKKAIVELKPGSTIELFEGAATE